ncbi:hypothetical protein ADL03_14475 [Nocardia sp. NRRL S-836]|nr:hypothetical protein ADL03_14475 [Nocardia sp. NRRL S-836]
MALADAFGGLLRAATATPKIEPVRQWVVDVTERGRRGVLVVRNSTAARATTTMLQEHTGIPFGWRRNILTVGLRDLLHGRVPRLPVDSIMFAGPVPKAFASLVAVPTAAELVVVGAGSWEGSRAARQITQTLNALTGLRRETVEISSPRLDVPTTGLFDDRRPVLVTRGGSPIAPLDDATSPWEPFVIDVLALLRRASSNGADSSSTAVPPTRNDTELVDALRISFTDGQHLWLAPNDIVYRRSGNEARRVAAKALVSGDVIALVDATARRDLFRSVIDVLATVNPEYHLLMFFDNLWHARIEAARSRNVGCRSILNSMRSAPDPTRITTEQAIRQWLSHHTVPMDIADVRRFAVAVEDEELRANADAVGSALAHMRTIHQAVGRWLSAQINGVQLRMKDSLVDPRLGVHTADLLETVSLHEIDDVAEHLEQTPASVIGVVQDIERV